MVKSNLRLLAGDAFIMRVISGTVRGVKIDTVNSKAVRPTTDKVKEAIFSIIQFDIEGSNFLDLFGGTGQIGIEAASRGAKRTVIVDQRRDAINVIRGNVRKARLDDCIDIVNGDALNYVMSTGLKFDFCFLDPPYGLGMLNKALSIVPAVMNESGVIITETPKEEEVMKQAGDFVLYRQYNYGRICINTYKNIKVIKGEE